MIEIAGQDEGHTRHSLTVKLPPRTRLEVGNDLFSVSYLRINSASPARIGIHSSVRRVTHLINADDWGNLWVEGLDLWLTGYITREEFNRRASFLPAGSRVFQYNATQVKSLVIPVSDLRALSELFERTKMVSPLTAA